MKQDGFIDVYGKEVNKKVDYQHIYYQGHRLDQIGILGKPKKHKGCL